MSDKRQHRIADFSQSLPDGPALPLEPDWQGPSRVKWARSDEVLWLLIPDVTTQTRIYKQALDQFFRRDFRDWRPRWGDFTVEILVVLEPGLPRVDLDNVAKAVLDGIKGALFHDDHQVARLVVERFADLRERVIIKVYPRAPGPPEA